MAWTFPPGYSRDISAGGLSMIAFALPQLTKNVTFRLELPALSTLNCTERSSEPIKKAKPIRSPWPSPNLKRMVAPGEQTRQSLQRL